MDPKALLDQFLGGSAGGAFGRGPGAAGGGLGGLKQKFDNSPLNSFGGGAAVGGVLGLLLGGKKVKKMAGGALGYGGAAVLGALALKAYQSYQQGRPPAQSAQAPANLAELTQIPPQQLPHALPARDGTPFELILMRAMIGAAKSDGHIDAKEQQHVFEQVERLNLDAESKACVFDMLGKPLDLQHLDASIGTEEQRAEIYLAARMATDADHPAERAYLDALAGRLQLPAALRGHLDAQISAAAQAVGA